MKKRAKLLSILHMRHSELVPEFLKALVDTEQPHIARMLGYEGLHLFVVLLISYR